MRNNCKLFFLLPLLLAGNLLLAQPKQNSPYSRYGIGDPVPQYFASQAGFAGQAAAFHDPFHLNLVNPASYGHLRATALEAGLYAKFSQYDDGADTKENWSGNLSYLALGFTLRSPINEALDKSRSPWQFGMGFALAPTTLVGYNVVTQNELPDLGLVTNSFEGNGGTYRLTWSNGVKYKNTAFGLNLGWMFGKAVYENTTEFRDSSTGPSNTFYNNFRTDLKISGLVWNAGLQHDFVLRYAPNDRETPVRWITLGLTGESNHDLNAEAQRLQIRSRGRNSAGQYILADTLLQVTGEDNTLTLPATFGAGIQFVRANKLRLGLQANLENWESYRNEAREDGAFRNAASVSGGVEYTPDYASYNNYLKRIRYRLGAYYRQDPRVVNGEDLNDVGLTFGFGFPLVLPRQQTSFINSAFEIGRLGAGSTIEETYFRITLGFTLNDNSWFYKRRFE
jgi:hypothetical protein